MKKVTVIAVAVLSLALTWAPSASAVQMTGGFSISNTPISGFEWLCPGPGDTGVNCPVASATLLDFVVNADFLKTPGVAGDFVVNSGSGSFTGIEGLIGKIRDFNFGTSFVSPGNFPSPPFAGFEIVGGVTVDLTSILSIVTTCSVGCTIDNDGSANNNPNSSLAIDGTILIHQAGFEATAGFFHFEGGQGSGNFSFSSQNTAVPTVPEPTSVLLLGLGLTGLVVGRRLKK